MVVCSVLSLLLTLGLCGQYLISLSRYASIDIGSMMFQTGALLVMVVVALGGIIGSTAMISRSNWVLAMLGCFCFLLPCSCLVLAFPLGVWGLIVVFQEGAKDDFREDD